MDDFQSAIAIVRATPISPPVGWRLVTKTPVEALQSIGLTADESRLSINCTSGTCAFSSSTGEPTSAPPGNSQSALVSNTADGWSTEQLAIDWPEVTLVLRESAFVDYHGGHFSVVARPTDVLAWGFSQSGNHLVLATERGFALWLRQ